MTTPDRAHRVRDLFDRVVDVDATARARVLDNEAAGDAALRREVELLVDADAHAATLLARMGVAEPADETALRSPAPDVGPYFLRERIGAGGMAEVYRAHDRRLERDVALKLLSAAGDARMRERFLREARAIAALRHPGVCEIYDIGEAGDGRVYIAMPLYEGETLAERIARGPVEPDVALRIAAAVAASLVAVHAAGIVHRDLKASNIMLPPDGGPILLDFGIAKAGTADALTRAGSILGTAGYMAPEQVGSRSADTRADLWALGVLLFEMLTAGRPFAGDSELAVLYAILHDPPPRLADRLSPSGARALGHRMPAVQALLDRLLARDPTHAPPPHRFSSKNWTRCWITARSRRRISRPPPICRRTSPPSWGARLKWRRCATDCCEADC